MAERFITSPHAQGTLGWIKDRLGRVTGSIADSIYIKRGENKGRTTLKRRLVLERIMGHSFAKEFSTPAMEWGTEQEPYSRMQFEAEKDLDVTQAGFLYLDDVMAGCSVDGLILESGVLGIWESKSPNSETHFAYVLDGVLPDEYRAQVIHNMWVTGAQFAWFTSYDPRMPKGLQTIHTRIERDDREISIHEAAVYQFLMETDALEKRVQLLLE